jgi:SHS2 domain-containing protein
MMIRYKFLNHTADAKFQAYGNSLEEAFQNAAEATANLMWSTKKVRPRIKRKVNITGKDKEQLLVKFLEEILFLLDSDDFLFCSVEGLSIKKEKADYTLEAWFFGEKISDKSEIFGSVKAVTYSDMVIEGNDHYLIQVVVDV